MVGSVSDLMVELSELTADKFVFDPVSHLPGLGGYSLKDHINDLVVIDFFSH